MFSLWVIDVKRTAKIQKRVRERVAKNLCLTIFDDKTECNGQMYSGGVCKKCSNAFYYELRQLGSAKARNKYRALLIERGLRLGTLEQRKLRRQSVSLFAKAAAQVEVA